MSSFRRALGAATLLAAVSVATSSTVRAEPSAPEAAPSRAPAPGTDGAKAEAERHYTVARALYAKGEYRGAIAELELARALDPGAKELVYNLAVVHEKLGDLDAAEQEYARYVEMESEPAERERVRSIVRRIRGAREEVKTKTERAAGEAGTATATVTKTETGIGAETKTGDAGGVPTERGRGKVDGWVLSAAGVSVVALAAGTAFGIKALADRPGADATTGPATSIDDLQASVDRAHREAIVADVAFGVAAISAGAAVWLYFSRFAEPPAEPRGARRVGDPKVGSAPPRVAVTPAGLGGAVTVAF